MASTEMFGRPISLDFEMNVHNRDLNLILAGLFELRLATPTSLTHTSLRRDLAIGSVIEHRGGGELAASCTEVAQCVAGHNGWSGGACGRGAP